MSILSISSIAFITLCALAALLSPISLPNALGMICYDSPYLSFSHPQRSFFLSPAHNLSHSSSTSSCVSQFADSTSQASVSISLRNFAGVPLSGTMGAPKCLEIRLFKRHTKQGA
jgi:hypothetical protein